MKRLFITIIPFLLCLSISAKAQEVQSEVKYYPSPTNTDIIKSSTVRFNFQSANSENSQPVLWQYNYLPSDKVYPNYEVRVELYDKKTNPPALKQIYTFSSTIKSPLSLNYDYTNSIIPKSLTFVLVAENEIKNTIRFDYVWQEVLPDSNNNQLYQTTRFAFDTLVLNQPNTIIDNNNYKVDVTVKEQK